MYFDFRLDLGYQQLMSQRPLDVDHRWAKIGSDPFPFQTLRQNTRDRMRKSRAVEIDLPNEWANRDSINGKFALHAQSWQLRIAGPKRTAIPIATLRMVYIRGQKNEIINTWIFPVRCDAIPVYAAELIAVNGVTRVAFVDIQTPGLNDRSAEEVAELTAPLAARFSMLPCDESAPDWAIAETGGNFTYARKADASWNSTIQDCYLSYLDTYMDSFTSSLDTKQMAATSEDVDKTEQLSCYQKHHMESSPGKKFLGSLFGVEWTDTFLTNFLFSKP